MTQSGAFPVRARVAPTPVFIDVMGCDRVKRMVLMSGVVVALVWQRRQRPEFAAALRDSARLVHTLPLPQR